MSSAEVFFYSQHKRGRLVKYQIAINLSWGSEVSKKVQEKLELQLRGFNCFEKEVHFNLSITKPVDNKYCI